MPASSIYLLSFAPTVSFPNFLRALSQTTLKPLTIARVIRWIILPSHISTSPLLARNIHWDLLLILPSTSSVPAGLQKLFAHHWTVKAGLPRKIVEGFWERNTRLLNPQKGDVPDLTGALDKPRIAGSTQGLELSEELKAWVEGFGMKRGREPVSMLNLLAFKPGSSRGGNAKTLGSIIHPKEGADEGEGWDEIALAHYPSIYHFADMIAGEDYQAVNQRHRVGSLRGTFILCTSELGVEDVMRGGTKL